MLVESLRCQTTFWLMEDNLACQALNVVSGVASYIVCLHMSEDFLISEGWDFLLNHMWTSCVLSLLFRAGWPCFLYHMSTCHLLHHMLVEGDWRYRMCWAVLVNQAVETVDMSSLCLNTLSPPKYLWDSHISFFSRFQKEGLHSVHCILACIHILSSASWLLLFLLRMANSTPPSLAPPLSRFQNPVANDAAAGGLLALSHLQQTTGRIYL